MRPSTIFRALWVVAGLALLLAWVREPVLRLIPRGELLARLDRSAPAPAATAPAEPWFTGGFRIGGTYPIASPGLLPPHVPHIGSYLDTDEWQGRAETVWFKAPRVVRVGVAGYPARPGCALWAEFRSAAGALTRVRCTLGDAHEQWIVWEVRRPPGAVAVRLVAEDRTIDHGGWLAFSHPFTAWPIATTAVYLHAQVYTTVALALTLVFGPGLIWLPRRAPPELRHVFLLGAGPLLLAAGGLAIWLLGGFVRPQLLGLATAALLWLALGASGWRQGFSIAISPALRRAFALTALVLVAVVAKSTYSVGPRGELFRGSISRNFTIGDRIDSRFSFYVVQAAAHHRSPAAPAVEKLFAPWTFFSRGPLAGLISLPVVMATNGEPPGDMPDEPWSPFDRQGFAAYRITMIALASGIVLAVFTLLIPFTGERWALVGAGLLALSPFGVHEVMFTWPKWAATVWTVLAFSLAHARRPLAAAAALSVGFFFHPLALLWAPWIGLWLLGRTWQTQDARPQTQHPKPRALRALVASARFSAGVFAFVLPWMALGAWMPHLPDTHFAGQGGFLSYWIQADWGPATWQTWWQTRWMNFANTFVPLHVFFHDVSNAHPRFTSAYEPSGPLVKFAQVWWVSLPFGLGLGLWAVSLGAIAHAARTLRAATWLFVFAPALFIAAYWGMDPLGLMRECGHPLFVAIIALTCIVAARHRRWVSRLLAHRATPWLQLPETWLMLWLTTLANDQPWGVQLDHLDLLCLAVNAFALAAAARLLVTARTALPIVALPGENPTPPPPPPPAHAAPRRLPALAWPIFALAVLAWFAGPLRRNIEQCQLLPAENNDAFTAATARGFIIDGAFPFTKRDDLPSGLATIGSWLGSDEFQGTAETGWLRAAPRFTIMFAGYPRQPGNQLELELRHHDGTVQRLPYDGPNAGETWQRWSVELPAGVDAVRIHATDASTSAGGWLAFSEPFTSHPIVGAQLWSLFQLLTTGCLALTVVFGPGLLWFSQRPRPLASLAFAILPGPLLLAALGLACWILGGIFPPIAVARAGIALLLAWLGWLAWQRRTGTALPSEIRVVVAASALLAGFAIAKANVSFGPRGELFRERVSRTLAVGGHSDSQISFHVVQAVAHHLGPYAEQTKLYFAPWGFASRGPLAGLMATPLVLASGAAVPFDHPGHPWRPFDRQGFAVYRIACIALAALAGWVVFGLVAALTSPAWGLVAATTALLAPFFVHEIYFTWPKLIAGALVLLAFLAAHRGKPFLAGVMLALGYLFHPLAALSGPFLGLWLLARPAPGPWWTRLITPAWFAFGALTLVIPWQLVGRLAPGGGADQRVFLTYFFIADNVPATAATWWQSRWDNFAHTFIPGWLLTADPTHESINSFYEPSDVWVRTSFLWWNTLPFALGLPGFLLVYYAVARACRRAFALTAVTLFAPALLLIAYWGAASTGLMRQCGHALFLSAIVIAIWSLARWPDARSQSFVNAFLHPACFAWRGLEIALMAFGTTLLNRHHAFADLFALNDLLSLLAAAACLVVLVILLAKTARSLRSTLFTSTNAFTS